jgi:TolA-binding protein
VKGAYASLASGNYSEALEKAEVVSRLPSQQKGTAEANYLKGYVQVYGQYRFKEGREALKGMVDTYPKHVLAPLAQKALADSFYWQGEYPQALQEYSRLKILYGAAGWGAYALYQSGNCLLLQHKDGDALAMYRDAVEQYPGDPMSDASMLRVAEVYRALDDDLQAREEFQHVLKDAKDPSVRAVATDELETIEHEEENPKNKGGPSE